MRDIDDVRTLLGPADPAASTDVGQGPAAEALIARADEHTATRRRRQRLGWKPRLALGAAAVVAAAVAVPLTVGSGDDPAWAVTERKDGSLRVEIHEFRDLDGLERRLEQAGVPADVTELPPGKVCKKPRATGAGWTMAEVTGKPGDAEAEFVAFVVRPSWFEGKDRVVVIEAPRNGRPSMDPGAVWLMVQEGPVKPCELVDAE